MPVVNPVSECAVAKLCVSATRVDHVTPLSVERSIMYPLIAYPLSFGAVHAKSMLVFDVVVVVRPVTCAGTSPAMTDTGALNAEFPI